MPTPPKARAAAARAARTARASRRAAAGLPAQAPPRRTDELLRAARAAESANRAKTAFLATMSHEIRTPMSGVIGLADVLRHSGLSPYQSDLVETIRESSQALMAIVDDLLDFSKIEAGRLDLERSAVDLRAVVEGVGDTLRLTAANRGVRLHVHVDPALPARVVSDGARLRQILVNLAGNSIKFSAGLARSGHVQLRATASADRLRLSVCDNGIGMDTAVLKRLFQPFAQGEDSISRRYGGTGLGLSIVHRLVQAFGGDIEVQSAPDRGSRFVVRLPLAAAAVDPADAAVEPVLQGLQVFLCLTDEEAARDWATLIEGAGATVRLAPDLRALQDAIPPASIVVTDAAAPAAARAGMRRLLTAQAHRLVCVSHGCGQSMLLDEDDDVHLDANALRRSALLHGLAVAAGRRGRSAHPTTRSVARTPCPPPGAEAAVHDRLILVAEDNTVNQMVIRRQLALSGFAAEVADDGVQALERWRSGRYALLLTDLRMPGLDGYELARRIRAEEASRSPPMPRTPIIALTASGSGGDLARCDEAGIDGCVRKPVTHERLAELLARHLMVREARAEPNCPTPEPPEPPVLDPSVLPHLVGGNAQVSARIRRKFLASAQRAADELRQAVAAADWGAARIVAHRTKSSSLAVGAMALGALSGEIERAAKAGDGAAVTTAQAEFDLAWARLRDRLRDADLGPPEEATVLLVDDDPFQLQVLQQQMQALHAGPVEVAASAADALALLAERDTSRMLVVTDLDMPDMDGVELMRRLAGQDFAGALALISVADERVLESGALLATQYRLNLIDHVRKPATPQVLGRMVSRWNSLQRPQPRPKARPVGVDEFRQALKGDEIVLHFQPQVSLSRRAVVGVEALVRWQHPRSGLVYPDSFVTLAEEHGLIGELTDKVIRLALAAQVRWRAQGLALPIAVNVSMDNLVQLDLPERLLRLLHAHGLPPECLRLEVTESRLMRDPRAAMDILTRLRLHRIGLAIDDFGTGHSSLAQLRDLPFDELKIDRGFVHGCSERPTQRGIVTASITMAHQLHMKAVAEGVEDQADWQAMFGAGCDVAQGWFIARPMPGEQLPYWAAEYAQSCTAAA